MESEANHLTDKHPAGYIDVGDDLMPYWTRDGRSIEEIWAEEIWADEGGEDAVDDTDEPPF